MRVKICPEVKQITYAPERCCIEHLTPVCIQTKVHEVWLRGMPENLIPEARESEDGLTYRAGQPEECAYPEEKEGYVLRISQKGILIRAADHMGLCYGMQTLAQIAQQAENGSVPCLEIVDAPKIKNRALMLDISRGKVYTRAYLMKLVDLLAQMRYNVLQLYVEHTFDFQCHPEISRGCDPITAEDILALQDACEERGIELQANLQSLGHCRHILTQPELEHLRESDMYWSFSTTSDEVIYFLDELYGEYLPLFKSHWLNVCLDEPYDIGSDRSKSAGKDNEELYVDYLLKLHKLAQKYGKRLMVFGDVFLHNPKCLPRLPEDILLLDWNYDPKPEYGTPAVLQSFGRPFWVCPGTGNWNTLFPRLDGAKNNIKQMTKEAVAAGAEGVMLTDWNDHGAYAQPAPSYYTYAYAGAVAWSGTEPAEAELDRWMDSILKVPGYAAAVQKMAEIYQIPPIWSKNRSECGMALFDEPIFGNAICGPVPPAELKAYDLTLPEGVSPVFERFSQHPLRPYFQLTPAVCQQVRQIVVEADLMIQKLPDGMVRQQLDWILTAFDLMLDKLALSREIRHAADEKTLDVSNLVRLEGKTSVLIKRYTRLQLQYVKIWMDVAHASEIELSMVYFAHIQERLDYLRDWMSLQREALGKGEQVDWTFSTYQTAGYTTLPTY